MLNILTCSKTISTWGRTRLFWGRNQLPSPSTDCINFLKPAYSKKQPRFLWKQPGNSLYRVFSKYTAHGINVVRKTTNENSRAGNDTQNHRELHQGTPENDNEMWVCFKPFTLFTYQLRYIVCRRICYFIYNTIYRNFSSRPVSFRAG